MEWVGRDPFCHGMGINSRKQVWLLWLHAADNNFGELAYGVELPVEEIDIIHPWRNVWVHQRYSLHPEIVIDVCNLPPVFAPFLHCHSDVVPCLPRCGAQHLAMDSDASGRSNHTFHYSFNNKADANRASVGGDGSDKRTADDWHIRLQQFVGLHWDNNNFGGGGADNKKAVYRYSMISSYFIYYSLYYN